MDSLISFFSNILRQQINFLNSIDFQKIEDGYKFQMKRILLCGFYPARYIRKLTIKEISTAKTEDALIKILSKQIVKNMNLYKNDFIIRFPKYKNLIDEVFDFYENKKYRLCILSLINICSLIFNKTFINVDPFEKNSTSKKLKEINVMRNNEKRYMIFIPIIDNESNVICKTFKNHPEEYKKYSFNRNAIIHGYVDDYDNELNALRWFSVLYNTLDIIKELVIEKE